MADNKLTLLLMRDHSGIVRSIKVSVRSLYLLLLAFCVFAAVLGWLLVGYYQQFHNQEEIGNLQRLTSRMQLENIRLTAAVTQMEADLEQLVLQDSRLRHRLDMPVDDTVVPVAMGGFNEVENGNPDDLLQQRIDILRKQVEWQRLRRQDITGFLNDQHSLLAAKPQGWPVKGWVTSGFGRRYSPFTGRRVMHDGLDIAASSGTHVYATADGVVCRVGNNSSYGKVVEIDHGYGLKTFYAHNSKIFVKNGQRVKRGDRISAVGNTGRSTGPHLHYEVRVRERAVNPRTFL